MIHLSNFEMEIVREILKKYVPESRVVVFGSRITDRIKPFSDLDLCIMGENPISENVLIDLKEAFSESDLPFRVDLLEWSKISPEFQKVILRNNEAIM